MGIEAILGDRGPKTNLLPIPTNPSQNELNQSTQELLYTQNKLVLTRSNSFDIDQFLVDPNVNYYKRLEMHNAIAREDHT